MPLICTEKSTKIVTLYAVAAAFAVGSGGVADAAQTQFAYAHEQPDAATKYSYITIDNTNADADPNFNQLLGINTYDILVGYDGDGTKKPNKGYLDVTIGHHADENFPGAAQTQAVGISNLLFAPVTVGFYVDSKGDNFGFVDQNGTFLQVSHPNTPSSGGVKTNQLLGVNINGVAVGFYNDAKGNSHGYRYDVSGGTFTAIAPAFSDGVTSLQVTGINDVGEVSGFYVNKKGVTKAFYYSVAKKDYVPVIFSGYTASSFFGINNKHQAVGSLTTAAGVSAGVVYNSTANTFQVIKDPQESSTAAFGVTGTTVNGINTEGYIVGFFSNGTKVQGFLARP